MDEILGSETGTDPAGIAYRALRLNPIRHEFDLLTVSFGTSGIGECNVQARRYPVILELGFEKDPEVQTYYGVRLETTYQPLLSPFGPVTLTAYSAAKPFGSRIGPPIESNGDLSSDAYKWEAQIQGTSAFIPNIPLQNEQDVIGFRSAGVLQKFHRVIASGSGPSLYNPEGRSAGIRLSRTPDLPEKGKYLIPHPTPTGYNRPFTSHTDEARSLASNSGGGATAGTFYHPPPSGNGPYKEGLMRFYAPTSNRIIQIQLQDAVSDLLSNLNSSNSSFTGDQLVLLRRQIRDMMADLTSVAALDEYQMFNVASIENTFSGVLNSVQQNASTEMPWKPEAGFPSGIGNANLTDWFTSWNRIYDPSDPDSESNSPFRSGYSVKFVPIQSFLNGGSGSTMNSMLQNASTIANTIDLSSIPGGNEDLQKTLRH
jgi:hypothetical protein